MPQTFLTIRGIDPLLFRDGRPFAAEAGGLTARSLPLPFPTTVAAFVRTQIGAAEGWDWRDHDSCIRAHGIPVCGPLLLRDGKIVLPAPKDAFLSAPEDSTAKMSHAPVRLAPRRSAGDCDLPDVPGGRLLPVMPPDGEEVTGKPASGFLYWPVDQMLTWLRGGSPGLIPKIGGLPMEERIGIGMDAVSRKAKDGELYAVQLRSFEEKRGDEHSEYALVARVNLPDGHGVRPAGTLGGERRLTVVETALDTKEIWPRPPAPSEGVERVRMVLATPAHFKHGWRPDWIEQSGSGAEHLPAGISKVKLKLVGAAMDRRVAVSGWSVREDRPRPIRWLVPAGAVYFFEVIGGDSAALWNDAWMKPMSDNEQDRRDGLGLALWGTW